MTGLDELLSRLAEVPRENGTASLHQTAAWLYETLEAAGVEVEMVPFQATPYTLRLAGVLALAGGLLYLRLMRGRRYGLALLTAVALPALLLAQLELYVPVFGWIGAETEHHVVARLPAVEPQQRLVFAAHYDTKTDLLDHVERAPVEFLATPLIGLMLLGAVAGWLASRVEGPRRWLRGLASVAAWAGAVYGVLLFLALSAGALLPKRSPGALDDGASCAALVRLVEELAAAPPPERTEVEVWLLAAEEVGVQGSWAYAAERFATPPELPTFVVNLEGLGASTRHGVFPTERFTLRSYPADPRLVALLDEVHGRTFERPLTPFPVGAATDARSFLAHGIPAATLFSIEYGNPFSRDLHSARDDRSRIDEEALAASVAFLADVAREADVRGLAAGAALP